MCVCVRGRHVCQSEWTNAPQAQTPCVCWTDGPKLQLKKSVAFVCFFGRGGLEERHAQRHFWSEIGYSKIQKDSKTLQILARAQLRACLRRGAAFSLGKTKPRARRARARSSCEGLKPIWQPSSVRSNWTRTLRVVPSILLRIVRRCRFT